MNSKKYSLVIISIIVFISTIKVTSLFYNNTPSITSDKLLTDSITSTINPAFDDTQSIAISKTENFTTNSIPPEKQKSRLTQIIENCMSNIAVADNDGLTENDDITNSDDFTGSNIAAQLDAYLTNLKLSNNSSDMLALFMQNYQASNTVNSDFIFELPSTRLHKEILFEQQLAMCSTSFNAKYCNEHLYAQANYIDKENAYWWFLIAQIHLSQNNIPDATEAFYVAKNKANYDEYYFEKINFIEQNAEQHSSLSTNIRLVHAIGVSSRFNLNYGKLVDYCKDSLDDLELADVCLQIGIKLEHSGTTLSAHSIGLALQEINYQHHLKYDLVAETKIKQNARRDTIINNSDYQAVVLLMALDERLARTWLNAGLSKGELFAISQTINEAKVFAQDINYLPCQ